MQEYAIEIKETLSRTLSVRSNSSTEALERIKQLYKKEEIVLDADDYASVSFKVINVKKIG